MNTSWSVPRSSIAPVGRTSNKPVPTEKFHHISFFSRARSRSPPNARALRGKRRGRVRPGARCQVMSRDSFRRRIRNNYSYGLALLASYPSCNRCNAHAHTRMHGRDNLLMNLGVRIVFLHSLTLFQPREALAQCLGRQGRPAPTLESSHYSFCS